jgi:hypothetical protein
MPADASDATDTAARTRPLRIHADRAAMSRIVLAVAMAGSLAGCDTRGTLGLCEEYPRLCYQYEDGRPWPTDGRGVPIDPETGQPVDAAWQSPIPDPGP